MLNKITYPTLFKKPWPYSPGFLFWLLLSNNMDVRRIFNCNSPEEFNDLALEVFGHQYNNNLVYKEFCDFLKKPFSTVKHYSQIPFLPIEFFKSKRIISGSGAPELQFTSSGTTGSNISTHYLLDAEVYRSSYLQAFEFFYGPVTDYCILALLPSYLERKGSSLIYMVDDLIAKSGHSMSGFYLNNLEELADILKTLNQAGEKVLFIGVSFALLEMAEKYPQKLDRILIMETGGMKGRRKELTRDELHDILKKSFEVEQIHSEYGMTELLSQAYSQGQGLFSTPPWMKILIRDPEDPLALQGVHKTGGINLIDLANLHSCSFIATQDLGKVHRDGRFEVLGRFDHSDIRGCNLMAL